MSVRMDRTPVTVIAAAYSNTLSHSPALGLVTETLCALGEIVKSGLPPKRSRRLSFRSGPRS